MSFFRSKADKTKLSQSTTDTGDAISAIIHALRNDTNASVRRRMAERLGEDQDPAHLDALLEATRDRDVKVRVAAINAAQQSVINEDEAPAAAIQAFTALSSDPHVDVRKHACRALGWTGTAGTPALLARLSDDESKVREAALRALRMLKATDSLDAVLHILTSDPDDHVRGVAADTLSGIPDQRAHAALAAAWHDASQSDDVRESVISAMGDARHPALIPALAAALRDPSAEFRGAAARAFDQLVSFNDEHDFAPALPALVSAFNDDDDMDIRRLAIEAMGSLAAPASLPTLLRATQDPDDDIRQQAYKALGRLPPGDGEAALINGLKDPHCSVRSAAAEGLARRETLSQWEPLLPHFADTRMDGSIRSLLAEPLARTGSPKAISALSAALADESDEARTAVCEALQIYPNSQLVEPLIACLEDEDGSLRAQAALSLAASAPPEAFGPLKRALDDEPEDRVRRRLVWALSFYPAKQSLSVLIGALKDDSGHVRAQAVRALAEICEVPELQRVLDKLPRHVPTDVRSALANAIAKDKPLPTFRHVRIGTVHYE